MHVSQSFDYVLQVIHGFFYIQAVNLVEVVKESSTV